MVVSLARPVSCRAWRGGVDQSGPRRRWVASRRRPPSEVSSTYLVQMTRYVLESAADGQRDVVPPARTAPVRPTLQWRPSAGEAHASPAAIGQDQSASGARRGGG